MLAATNVDLVLVGGQSLAIWVDRYDLALPVGVASVSSDVDFLSLAVGADGRRLVQQLAQRLNGRSLFPSRRALTALIGQVQIETAPGSSLSVDIIHRIMGPSIEHVVQRALQVELGAARFRLMHPLDVLHSRLANLHQLRSKQDDKGRMQLALAIAVAREFVREQARTAQGSRGLASGRSPVQGYVSAIERLATSDAGRKSAARHGLHVADAIDAALIPAGPFWTRRWPVLKALMSPAWAAQFKPPRP